MYTRNDPPITMKERFWKYASTKSEGTRVFNLLEKHFGHEPEIGDFSKVGLFDLMKINGVSRKAAKVIVDVVADFID